jgi:hypothetical protein
VRLALEAYLGRAENSRSAYERAKAAGLIGCLHSAPKKLSTNHNYFQAFGKSS